MRIADRTSLSYYICMHSASAGRDFRVSNPEHPSTQVQVLDIDCVHKRCQRTYSTYPPSSSNTSSPSSPTKTPPPSPRTVKPAARSTQLSRNPSSCDTSSARLSWAFSTLSYPAQAQPQPQIQIGSRWDSDDGDDDDDFRASGGARSVESCVDNAR